MTETFYKEPVTRANVGCLELRRSTHDSAPEVGLAVGFGMVSVTRNDEYMWSGDDETMTVYRWTRRAKKEPEADWGIAFYGPLHEETYQFQYGQWG